MYFKDPWNRFDFFLVVVGVLDVALSFLHSGFMRILRIFRLQRLLRVMRLVRKSKVRCAAVRCARGGARGDAGSEVEGVWACATRAQACLGALCEAVGGAWMRGGLPACACARRVVRFFLTRCCC